MVLSVKNGLWVTMVSIDRYEIVIGVLGALAAFVSWPIGVAVDEVGKVLVTAAALGLLIVCLITLVFFHKDFQDLAIQIIRKEVAYFIPFGIVAVIVLIATL